MPLYVAEFAIETAHLSAIETGIYIRLIMHCWEHGTIPRDDRRLALIAHCDPRLWHQYRGTVLQFFDIVDASTMQHQKTSAELHRCDEISNKRKAAAQQMHSNCTAIAEQLHTHARASSQSQSQSQREEKNRGSLSRSRARERATPMSADFRLTQADVDYALRQPGWDRGRVQSEFERFCDHAAAKGSVYCNWHAAWRNWTTSRYQGGSNGSVYRQKRHASDTARELADELRSLERAAAIDGEADWLRGGRNGG